MITELRQYHVLFSVGIKYLELGIRNVTRTYMPASFCCEFVQKNTGRSLILLKIYVLIVILNQELFPLHPP